MPPNEYGFHEQLAMSNGVSANKNVGDILLGNIPGAVSVIRAHESNDRSGVDYWVEMGYGGFASVDTKIRKEDWAVKGEDDLALETFSVVEKGIIGWTRNPEKRTDYILWFWKDTGRWCLLPFRMLCRVFEDNWESWLNEFGGERQYTPGRQGGNGYHSECVFVPRKIVWGEIYKHYGGLTKKSWQDADELVP